MSSRWNAPPSSTAGDEDGGGPSSPSSFSDVFAGMLTVNEDLIMAAAECQAEQDTEGLIAYQRILHRDLLEMAEFIDSTFGVYSNNNITSNHTNFTATANMKKRNESEQPPMLDLRAESFEGETPAIIVKKTVEPMKKLVKKTSRGALLKAIEDGERVREIQRTNEQWIKSRHQVLEEEGVSAIMNESTSGMLEVPGANAGENAEQQGHGGLALANQLRAHQHVAAFMKATAEAAAASASSTTPMNLLLTNPLAMTSTQGVPGSFPPPPLPMTTVTTSGVEQPIRPNTVGSTTKVALPSAHMYNMYMPFARVMFNPHTTGGLPTWQPPMPAALPARPTIPVRPPANTPDFKRMCESCRKRHFSVRRCRLVLQHTDPEWQTTQQVPPNRRRKLKQSTTNITEEVT